MRHRKPLLLLCACLGLLAACARPGGLSAGAEGCRAQATSFNEAGDPFIRPAAPRWWMRPPQQRPRTAEINLPNALRRENAELDRLQIAFDSLLYCRWIEARTVRADLASGRTPRPEAEARMAALRARLRADLDRARAVIAELERQAAARLEALESEAPGTAAAAAQMRRSQAGAPRPVTAAATVTLRLRPEASAPEVGRVGAGQAVTIRPAAAGFAAVEARGQVLGYAPAGAFQIAERRGGHAGPALAGPGPRAAPAEAAEAPLRTLAATNLARRDNFAESVALAETSAVSGFELAS